MIFIGDDASDEYHYDEHVHSNEVTFLEAELCKPGEAFLAGANCKGQ